MSDIDASDKILDKKERQAFLKDMLSKTEVVAVSKELPADIKELFDGLNGLHVKDFLAGALSDDYLISEVKVFKTKKGEVQYSLYDTGMYPVDVGKLGSRKLRAKIVLNLV